MFSCFNAKWAQMNRINTYFINCLNFNKSILPTLLHVYLIFCTLSFITPRYVVSLEKQGLLKFFETVAMNFKDKETDNCKVMKTFRSFMRHTFVSFI